MRRLSQPPRRETAPDATDIVLGAADPLPVRRRPDRRVPARAHVRELLRGAGAGRLQRDGDEDPGIALRALDGGLRHLPSDPVPRGLRRFHRLAGSVQRRPVPVLPQLDVHPAACHRHPPVRLYRAARLRDPVPALLRRVDQAPFLRVHEAAAQQPDLFRPVRDGRAVGRVPSRQRALDLRHRLGDHHRRTELAGAPDRYRCAGRRTLRGARRRRRRCAARGAQHSRDLHCA